VVVEIKERNLAGLATCESSWSVVIRSRRCIAGRKSALKPCPLSRNCGQDCSQ
jgi:hypothetical protein